MLQAAAPAASSTPAPPAHPPVTASQPWRKCYVRAVGRDGPGGLGCAMCLSETEHGDPFCWKQAHLDRERENVQRATYHAIILGLAAALKQGFSEVFFMGYNEIVTKQVRPVGHSRTDVMRVCLWTRSCFGAAKPL